MIIKTRFHGGPYEVALSEEFMGHTICALIPTGIENHEDGFWAFDFRTGLSLGVGTEGKSTLYAYITTPELAIELAKAKMINAFGTTEKALERTKVFETINQ